MKIASNRRIALFATSALCAIPMALAAPSANATVITTTATYPTSATDWNNLTQAFNLFNTSLGTLTQITIAVTIAGTSSLTITNTGAGVANGAVKSDTELVLGDSGGDTLNQLFSANYNTQSPISADSPYDGVAAQATGANKHYTLAVGASTTVSDNETASTSNYTVASGDFSDFSASGGGTELLEASTATSTDSTQSGGNASFNQTTTDNATVVISYTYTPSPPPPPPPSPPPPVGAPEPASMLLMGAGLAGLGMAVRRKRRT